MIKLSENPAFPAAELGYQAENLEMLTYVGRQADPWASWEAMEPQADWVFSYQAGPGAPVRGCVVNQREVMQQLSSELSDQRLARIELVPFGRYSESKRTKLAAKGMPGWVLVAEPGTLFTEKQNTARLWALGVVSLLGLFLLGAVFLARYSQREVLDAERKTTFVTQVSHELRTPLTSIRMFADMLGAPTVTEEKRAKFAGMISRESERLSALIERLLTFNTLEQGKQPVAIVQVDVGDVVRETVEEMDATLRAAGMRAESHLPDGPVLASGDRTAIKQALLNLLDNALKYARDGELIELTLARDGADVRLRIADRGAGIPRSLGERAFEPFVQGSRSLHDKSPGVGLGLSIARGVLRKAGGDLVLLPSERGALFEIRLPAASLA
jgi:signal transduction histidine kinase